MFDQPQFEKPIMVYWLLRAAALPFGLTSFAARFFPSLFAIAGALAVYLIGVAGFRDERKAFLASLILMTSAIYVGLARTVFTDMIFTVFILLAMLAFYWGYAHPARKAAGLVLCFACAGLAALTKGPLGLLLPLAVIVLFLAVRRELRFLLSWPTLWGALVCAAIAVPWYWLMISRHGAAFTNEFFYNDHVRRVIEAEHHSSDTWWFYPAFLTAGVFPWSLFLVAALVSLARRLKQSMDPFLVFVALWIYVMFCIFQMAHSKLVSYVLPLFPALALLTANFIVDAFVQARPRRAASLAAAGTALALLSVPFAGTLTAFKMNLPLGPAVFIALGVACLFPLAAAWFILAFRSGNLWRTATALAAVTALVLAIVGCLAGPVEPYLTPRRAIQYLEANYPVKGTIVTTPFFARSVKFYTNRDVAALNLAGRGFFSPHPIPMLNDIQTAWDFLRRQPVTYAVVDKAGARQLHVLSAKDLRCEILKVFPNQYLIRTQPK
jgi:4-amino-4-deoxy-L-arabinose transferase-like glycosyltransferase